MIIKLSIQPAAFYKLKYIEIFLHDSYIPQRYPSLQCWVIIPDSPTFYFRAPRLVGTRKLPCRAPFSQMLSQSQDPIHRVYLVLRCETLGGLQDVCVTNRMASQWEAESTLFLFKTFWLTKPLLHAHRDIQAGFWKCRRDARQQPICCLLELF